MSKGLEALEEIIHEFNEPHIEINGEYSYKNELLRRCEEEINIIEKELQHLERIDNSNPSEAMQCLENLCDEFPILKKDYKIINQALIKSQENEKVLKEIIILINDLEPTFNRKGMVSIDDDNLGTFIKDYFIDNASELLKRYFK